MQKIGIIVAVDSEFGIAKDKKIPWLAEDWSKDDLKRFKQKTDGGVLICGRNTYNEIAGLRSIGNEVLPNRTTYVITSNPDNLCPGAITIDSIQKVLELEQTRDIFFIGGERIFEEGLKYTNEIHLTQTYKHYDCDQFLQIVINDGNLIHYYTDKHKEYNYTYLTIERN